MNTETVLNDNPMIYQIDLFLTPDECNHLIAVAHKEGFEKSKVFGTFIGSRDLKRKSKTVWIKHNYDEQINNISLRISKLIGISLEYAELLQVSWYEENGKFADHYDGWNHLTTTHHGYLEKGGQRLITCMIYLNEAIEGGETQFTHLMIRIKPQIGRLVIFSNVIDGTNKLHKLSKHCGMPVIKGEKYICNLWFRENKLIRSNP